jgi:hypothetical protein
MEQSPRKKLILSAGRPQFQILYVTPTSIKLTPIHAKINAFHIFLLFPFSKTHLNIMCSIKQDLPILLFVQIFLPESYVSLTSLLVPHVAFIDYFTYSY